MSSPLTEGLLSKLRSCVVNGSENEEEGGETKGGGNGRDGRFGQAAYPVSNRKGDLRIAGVPASGAGVETP